MDLAFQDDMQIAAIRTELSNPPTLKYLKEELGADFDFKSFWLWGNVPSAQCKGSAQQHSTIYASSYMPSLQLKRQASGPARLKQSSLFGPVCCLFCTVNNENYDNCFVSETSNQVRRAGKAKIILKNNNG